MATGPLTLQEVDDAIRAVMVAGQKYRFRNGQEVTQADLGELRALRNQLADEQLAASSGGVVSMPVRVISSDD